MLYRQNDMISTIPFLPFIIHNFNLNFGSSATKEQYVKDKWYLGYYPIGYFVFTYIFDGYSLFQLSEYVATTGIMMACCFFVQIMFFSPEDVAHWETIQASNP